jgi:hypothetical protein
MVRHLDRVHDAFNEADNHVLLDIGNILHIQLSARYGTYVASNALLCMRPAIRWARRNDSEIEHNLAQVR